MAQRNALQGVERPVESHLGWHAYVDGSFYDGITSFGLIVLNDDVLVKEYSKTVPLTHEETGARNIIGELWGAMAAMQWMERNNVHSFHLHYDYTGIRYWAEEYWTARQWWSKQYVEYMSKAKPRVTWVKISEDNENQHSKRVHDLANLARTSILA